MKTVALSIEYACCLLLNIILPDDNIVNDVDRCRYDRMVAHTDYVTDLALIERGVGGGMGDDSCDVDSPVSPSVHSQSTELSILSGSTDKTIRLSPFSVPDGQFL